MALKRKTTETGTPIKREPVVLNQRQQAAITAAVADQQHVFLTGSAGVGKSFVLREMIAALREVRRVGVTGSTGIAAVPIGGVTVYSFFKLTPDMIEKKILRPCPSWKEIDTLVIDEVSMLHPDLFLYLDCHAKLSRGSDNPFGGVQLILVGDFFQLPPVHKSEPAVTFIFELPLWQQLFSDGKGLSVELTAVYRQQDQEFVQMLERVRRGKVSFDDSLLLSKLAAKQPAGYTKLFGKVASVSRCNELELKRLPGESMQYQLSFAFESLPNKPPLTSKEREKYEKETTRNLPISAILELKEKALVMLVANVCLEMGLANGSCGEVQSFDTDGLPIVKFESVTAKVRPYDWVLQLGTRCKATVTGVPLTLAYAITIHKSQGQTIDKLFVDLHGVWEYGQAYTSLSRAKSLSGLVVNNFKTDYIKAHPKVLEFYQRI